MFKWILILAILFSGAALAFYYFEIRITRNVATPPLAAMSDVAVIHSFRDGVHRYSGQLRLPHSCFEIKTNVVQDPKDHNVLTMSILTTDNKESQKVCIAVPTSYPFSAITDAPEGAVVTLEVNAVDVQMYLVETEWQNPRGTYLNLENN